MARVSTSRALQNEENVARRITREREARGWTYEETARRMVDAGVPLQYTAIYKIEKATPRRRITVDELVGFATIFELDVADLLTPVELIEHQEVNQALHEWVAAGSELRRSLKRLGDCWARLVVLRETSSDLPIFEYLDIPEVRDLADAAAQLEERYRSAVETGKVGRDVERQEAR